MLPFFCRQCPPVLNLILSLLHKKVNDVYNEMYDEKNFIFGVTVKLHKSGRAVLCTIPNTIYNAHCGQNPITEFCFGNPRDHSSNEPKALLCICHKIRMLLLCTPTML